MTNLGTILVVDDDRGVRMILRNCLQNAGYSVVLGEDGEEALRLIQEHPVDAVIMDMHMPVLNGWEACIVIRNQFKIEIPIIAHSSYESLSDQARAVNAGCTDFLPKPVDVGQLFETLTSALSDNNGSSKRLP